MIGRQRTETASRLPCVQNIVGHRRADNKPRAFSYPYITLNMLLFARLFAFLPFLRRTLRGRRC
jgi:hypothetical protein